MSAALLGKKTIQSGIIVWLYYYFTHSKNTTTERGKEDTKIPVRALLMRKQEFKPKSKPLHGFLAAYVATLSK